MSLIKDWFKSLFKKKILLYTAIDHEDYFRVVNKLANQGVKYRIKIPVDTRSRNYFTEMNNQYLIYVYQEDEGRAIEAIHKLKP